MGSTTTVVRTIIEMPSIRHPSRMYMMVRARIRCRARAAALNPGRERRGMPVKAIAAVVKAAPPGSA
jgi:hypothetical protein